MAFDPFERISVLVVNYVRRDTPDARDKTLALGLEEDPPRKILLLSLVEKVGRIPDLAVLHSVVFIADNLLMERRLPRFGYGYIASPSGPYSTELTSDLQELDSTRKWITNDNDGVHLTPLGKRVFQEATRYFSAGLKESLKCLDAAVKELDDSGEPSPYALAIRASRFVDVPIGHKVKFGQEPKSSVLR